MAKQIRWTQEKIDFIKQNKDGRTRRELAAMFNSCFGLNITVNSIKSVCRRKIISGRTSFCPTTEQLEFCRVHASLMSRRSLTSLFNVTFGTEYGTSAIKYLCKKEQFPTFRTRRKPITQAARTRLPIGSEIPCCKVKGMVLIKIDDSNTWRYKHWVIWEKYHGRQKPSDSVIVFANGDVTDFNVSNLIEIPRKESAYLARRGYFLGSAETVSIGRLLGQIAAKRNEMTQPRRRKTRHKKGHLAGSGNEAK